MITDQLRPSRLLAAGAIAVVLGAVVWIAVDSGEESTVRQAAPAPSATPAAAPPTVTPRVVGRPERLTIRRINVDAPVSEVGTTSAGAQEVPPSIDDTGWWRDGVEPGRRGNAVIVGHTASSADGVFDDLGKLRRGDEMRVKSEDGTLTYAVSSVTDVKVSEFAKVSARVYRTGGRPGLVLMTCGDWNGKSYESTTIVFGRLLAS